MKICPGALRSFSIPRRRGAGRGAAALLLLLGALACTSKPKEPVKQEPKEEPKPAAEPEAAPTPSTSVAVTTFIGADGEAGWLGTLIADHVTRRLHLPASEERDEVPLYVFGWRQAMSAARSIDLDANAIDARASDLIVELGVDHLVAGSYTIEGDAIAIRWKIIDADGTSRAGEASGAKGASARTAYELGGTLLKELVPGAAPSDDSLTELAAVGAGEAWGEAMALLAKQSRDPRATVVLSDVEIDTTLKKLEQVTQTVNDFAPGWAARATVASMGYGPQEEIAMSSAKAAMNVGASDPTAAISLYYMHQQLAEQTKARELLEQALSTYPGSLEVRNYLAQAYYLASEYEKCLEVWNEYLEHVPRSAHAARRRDRMLSRMGKHEEAVKNATELVAEHPDSVPTIAALASRQIDAKKLDAAKQTLQDALKKDPDHPLLLTRLSYVELESGSPKEALQLAEKAVERIGDGRGEPLAGYAHIDLARAQALTGNKAKAKKTLRKALRLGVGGDDIVRLANDPRLEGFIELPLVLGPDEN